MSARNETEKHLQKDDSLAMPSVSVIVPVWNPGEKIYRCIERLRNQTLNDIEMIFVDDRGSDDAMEIIRKAAGEDKRIRILVNPENLGPGPSRNRGIEASRGKYVSFVDADDYVEKDFLEKLVGRALREDLDVVKGFAVVELEHEPANWTADEKQNKEILSVQESGGRLYAAFRWAHWSAVYRREFILSSGAGYGNYRSGEDALFLLRICFFAKRFAVEKKALYHYIARPDSLSRCFTAERLEDNLSVFREQLAFLNENVRFEDQNEAETAAEYVEMQLRNALEVHLRCSSVFGMEQDNRRFLNEIREAVSVSALCDVLKSRWVDAYALVQYGANLCTRSYGWSKGEKKFEDVLHMIKNWENYLREHGDEEIKISSGLYEMLAFCADLALSWKKWNRNENAAILESRMKRLYRWYAVGLPAVSVVLPVWNPGESIRRCLHSLRNQTLSNIELIFVDDCGTDDSMEIVHQAAKEDSRIKIIKNTENLGAGPSRNVGIENARGLYMAFVDPDDDVAPDFLELLFEKARLSQFPDIVKGSLYYLKSGNDRCQAVRQAGQDRLLEEAECGQREIWASFRYGHQTALFLRYLIIMSDSRYGSSRNAQDTTFLLRICRAAATIALEKRAKYYYIKRADSATQLFRDSGRLDSEMDALREQFAVLMDRYPLYVQRGEFTAGKVTYFLGILECFQEVTGDEKTVREYLEKFRSMVLQLPSWKYLKESFVVVYALIEHHEGIHLKPFSPFWYNRCTTEKYQRMMEKLVDFALSDPIVTGSSIYMEDIDKAFRLAFLYFRREIAKKGMTPELYRFYRFIKKRREELQEAGTLQNNDHSVNDAGKTEQPLVSVIVPVYNPGRAFHLCVSSLQNQTLSDVEFLFIDDCGNDQAMNLVRRAADQDERVRVLVNPENMGSGFSRNEGIKAARGKYLAFIDADDFLEQDFLELLFLKAQETYADLTMGTGMFTSMKKDGDLCVFPLKEAENKDPKKPLYCRFFMHQLFLYRTDYLLRNEIWYGTSGNAQDTTFLLKAFHKEPVFSVEKRAIYYQMRRPDSATQCFTAQRLINERTGLVEKIDYICLSMQKDPYAAEYIFSQIQWALQVHLRVMEIPELEEEAKRFLIEINDEINRLPFAAELSEKYPEVGMLKYGVNLCRKPQRWHQGYEAFFLGGYIRIITNWVDFMLEHPEVVPKGNPLWYTLSLLYQDVLSVYMRILKSGSRENNVLLYFRQLQAQMNRLNAAYPPSDGAKGDV